MTDNSYFKVSKKAVILTLAALGLVIASATAASYVTRENIQTASTPAANPQTDELKAQNAQPPQDTPAPVKHEAKHAHPPHQQMAQAQPPCNDHNIVGDLAGGVGGGVLGSLLGHGTGKTVTTIGGALGGAYLGNQYIPTQNVTCK